VATTALVNSLSAAADAVEGSAADLNRLDGYAGDGDLGITMSQAAQALREVLAGSGEQTDAQLLSSCGAAVGDRTLVDGLDAVTNSLGLSLSSGLNTKEALSQAARAATAAAEATAEMEPKAGRASWVPERAKGHPDAGCEMLAIALEAVATKAGSA
jgi:hypothetical protein